MGEPSWVKSWHVTDPMTCSDVLSSRGPWLGPGGTPGGRQPLQVLRARCSLTRSAFSTRLEMTGMGVGRSWVTRKLGSEAWERTSWTHRVPCPHIWRAQ